MQGHRPVMENRHLITEMISKPDHIFMGLFDGHSGSLAAYIVSKRLVGLIERTSAWREYLESADDKDAESLIRRALLEAFDQMDDELERANKFGSSGCTCVCVIITPSLIICANLGKSRCVMKSAGQIIQMTDDHTALRTDEILRICKAGSIVKQGRINGELAVSRALGNFRYKANTALSRNQQLLICTPEISCHRRIESDELLLLACDGVWDVLSCADAIHFLTDAVIKNHDDDRLNRKHRSTKRRVAGSPRTIITSILDEMEDARESMSCQYLAEALIDWAFVCGSKDNLSSIVVKLHNNLYD
jgi:serine/threonine protein phosphatase PrpC